LPVNYGGQTKEAVGLGFETLDYLNSIAGGDGRNGKNSVHVIASPERAKQSHKKD
jgi:hypothetical protein